MWVLIWADLGLHNFNVAHTFNRSDIPIENLYWPVFCHCWLSVSYKHSIWWEGSHFFLFIIIETTYGTIPVLLTLWGLLTLGLFCLFVLCFLYSFALVLCAFLDSRASLGLVHGGYVLGMRKVMPKSFKGCVSLKRFFWPPWKHLACCSSPYTSF